MYNHYFSNFGRPPRPGWFKQRFSPKASSALEEKILKVFPYMGMAAFSVNEPRPF